MSNRRFFVWNKRLALVDCKDPKIDQRNRNKNIMNKIVQFHLIVESLIHSVRLKYHFKIDHNIVNYFRDKN